MNSQKTKTKEYTLVNGKAVAGVVIEAYFNDSWAVTVAWEWPMIAEDGFFALTHLVIENTDFNKNEMIAQVADYGIDVSHIEKFQKKFPKLF